MYKWPVLVINLDRSVERWEGIVASFPAEDLTRVPGVDGRMWESGEYTKKGRPLFSAEALHYLYQGGILGESALELWPWVPCEVGCALGHVAAWNKIVQDDIPWAIVMEDDSSPTEAVQGTLQESIERQLGVPEDAEVIFLMGADSNHRDGVAEIDADNRFLRGRGNLGYAISLAGAKRAIEATFPMFLPCDLQWWMRAFKNFRMFGNIPLDPIEKGQAYAMTKALVKHSALAVHTTFTESGSKPWKRLGY